MRKPFIHNVHNFYCEGHTCSKHGEQKIFLFENGYAASVVRNLASYGSAAGLWELAVMICHDPNPSKLETTLVFDTPITNDVIGWLNEDQVEEILQQIESLPLRTKK